MRTLSFCLLAGVLLTIACRTGPQVREEAPEETARMSEDFYPLAVGSRWTYEVRAPGQVGRQSVDIIARESGWFLDSLGGRLRVDSLGLRDPDRYLLRVPLVVGTKWSNVESVQSIERHEIVEAGKSCRTRAGAWDNCVVVRSENAVTSKRTFVLESTYAEGVGLVAQRTMQEERGLAPVVVLERELLYFEKAP